MFAQAEADRQPIRLVERFDDEGQSVGLRGGVGELDPRSERFRGEELAAAVDLMVGPLPRHTVAARIDQRQEINRGVRLAARRRRELVGGIDVDRGRGRIGGKSDLKIAPGGGGGRPTDRDGFRVIARFLVDLRRRSGDAPADAAGAVEAPQGDQSLLDRLGLDRHARPGAAEARLHLHTQSWRNQIQGEKSQCHRLARPWHGWLGGGGEGVEDRIGRGGVGGNVGGEPESLLLPRLDPRLGQRAAVLPFAHHRAVSGLGMGEADGMADPLVIDDAVAPPAGDTPSVAADEPPAPSPIGEVDRARAPGGGARDMEPAVSEGAVELPALAGGRLAGEVIERAPVDVAQDKEDGKGAIGIAADVDRPVDFGEGAEKRGVAVPNAEHAGRRGRAEGLRVDPGHEPRSARELAVVEAAHALAEPFDALLPVGERLPVGGDKVDDRGTDRVDRVAAIPGGEAGRLLAIGGR